MKPNDKCSNCSASIDSNTKFCGGCGTKVPSKNSQIAVDLFSIDSQEPTEPEEDQWDEFLDSQPESTQVDKVEEENDFFAIDDDFEDEEIDTEDQTIPEQPEIEKKVFTEEDDPSLQAKVDSTKEKKVDKKLKKAIKKKNALKIKSKETKLSFMFFGLLSLLISSPLLIFVVIDFIPKDLLSQVPVKSLKIFPHPIYACVFFVPSLFRFILNSKTLIKIKSRKQFSQYFGFFTCLAAIFLCASIAQFLSSNPKDSILFSLQIQDKVFSIDHYYLGVASYLLFCQIFVHYLFKKKIPFIISAALSSCLIISNIQLYVYLAIPDEKLLFQESSNILGQQLAYYLGPLHSYVMPNYLLSQIVLPGLLLILLILTLKDLFTKDFTSFFYGLYSSTVFSIVFLYINKSYLLKTTYSLSNFLKPIFAQIQNFS